MKKTTVLLKKLPLYLMLVGGLALTFTSCDPNEDELGIDVVAGANDDDVIVDPVDPDPVVPDPVVPDPVVPDPVVPDPVDPGPVTAPDPVLVNADFNKIPKSSGSDCACSAWINKDIGDQAESTSGNGGDDNVTKIDNDEQDAAYQEFAVVKNAEYKLSISVGFDGLSDPSTFPAVLELRVLAASGYIADYVPTFFTLATDFPQSEAYGYRTTDQVEVAANNLLTETIAHPGNTDYTTYEYTFNAGDNDSVAIYFRGIDGDGTPADGQDKGHNFTNGEEEIQIDYIKVESVNKP